MVSDFTCSSEIRCFYPNGPRARFHGAPFEIVKSTKLAISVRQKQKDNSVSSSSLSIKEGQLSELDKVYMQLQ